MPSSVESDVGICRLEPTQEPTQPGNEQRDPLVFSIYREAPKSVPAALAPHLGHDAVDLGSEAGRVPPGAYPPTPRSGMLSLNA